MTTYLIRRTLQAVVVLILSTFVVFAVMRWLPGDPILLYISSDTYARTTDQAQIDALRHEYGLDKSVPEQYIRWVGGALRGDLGRSIFRGTSVTDELARAVPVTLYLGLTSFIFAHLLGIPAGITCAIRRGKWLDSVLTVFANIGVTAPVFWVGILLVYLFGLKLGWLPVQGYTSPFVDLKQSLLQLIMPAFCLALGPLAGATRTTRSAMLEVVHQDYVRTAWAKGMSERRVVLKHIVKNGILPVVTLGGMAVPMIIGGAVLVEQVFNIPGVGRLSITALFSKDYAIVQGVVLVVSVAVVLTNLITDISYGWLDPRVRVK
ncbi:MAG: ABC transporter permease [Thermoleophilia bacterium]